MKLLFILGVIGPLQAVLILAVILLIFGGKKIPGLVKGVIKGIKDFKEEVKDESGNVIKKDKS